MLNFLKNSIELSKVTVEPGFWVVVIMWGLFNLSIGLLGLEKIQTSFPYLLSIGVVATLCMWNTNYDGVDLITIFKQKLKECDTP